MRTTPMRHREVLSLQYRLLNALGLPHDANLHRALNAPVDADSWRNASERQYTSKASLALEISDIFIDLAETDSPLLSAPATEEDMVQEIRYSFGWSWLTWLFMRAFVRFVVHWLWQHYHKDTDDGEDFGRSPAYPSPGAPAV